MHGEIGDNAGNTRNPVKGTESGIATTAPWCKENGMTIEEIQTLLGHSSPETTRKYLGTFDPTQQMVAAHRRASPVDRFLAGRTRP
jgi:hypothetical protein